MSALALPDMWESGWACPECKKKRNSVELFEDNKLMGCKECGLRGVREAIEDVYGGLDEWRGK